MWIEKNLDCGKMKLEAVALSSKINEFSN